MTNEQTGYDKSIIIQQNYPQRFRTEEDAKNRTNEIPPFMPYAEPDAEGFLPNNPEYENALYEYEYRIYINYRGKI